MRLNTGRNAAHPTGAREFTPAPCSCSNPPFPPSLQRDCSVPFHVAPYTWSSLSLSLPEGTRFVKLVAPSIPFENADSFPWVQYTHTLTAWSTKTKVTFHGTDWGAHFSLDDVVVRNC